MSTRKKPGVQGFMPDMQNSFLFIHDDGTRCDVTGKSGAGSDVPGMMKQIHERVEGLHAGAGKPVGISGNGPGDF
jgi:hypothetical protein